MGRRLRNDPSGRDEDGSRGLKPTRYNKAMVVRALTITALLLGCALPARGQQSVTLQFSAGQVTLSAQNATVRAILAEWARLGGATIVNGDRVAGPPVTLELTGVPERQALDIVLRSVAGYMLAPRRAGSPGASAYDRILILPTSVAPRNPPTATPALPRPGVIARQPVVEPPAPVDAGQDDLDPDVQESPEVSQPRTGDPRIVRPPFVIRPPAQPGAAPLDSDAPDDAAEPDPPTPAGSAPTPTNPFGVPFGSSATPGVVAPAPQQQQRPGTNRVQ